jgi:hypothetical protein
MKEKKFIMNLLCLSQNQLAMPVRQLKRLIISRNELLIALVKNSFHAQKFYF